MAPLNQCEMARRTQTMRRLSSLSIIVGAVVLVELILDTQFRREGSKCGGALSGLLPLAFDKSITHRLPTTKANTSFVYTPSSVEQYVMDNAHALGYNSSSNTGLKPTCTLWKDSSLLFHSNLTVYRKELVNYSQLVNDFVPISDLRLSIDKNPNICDSLKLHPNGLQALFSESQQVSFGTSFGAIEPLLPPMRSPEVCFDKRYTMNMNYMIHDFHKLCQALKPTSRIILVDMGASLDFHGANPNSIRPAIYLTELYTKFGFPFDHVYAYEVTPKDAKNVYQKIPESLLSSYHWINAGVEADSTSRLNPLHMILSNYNEDDIIIVKLDIDTSSIEVPLAMQILANDRLQKLVDVFYFEHHVFIYELAPSWKTSMNGTLLESLQLFSDLRKKGVAAHSWV